MNYGRKNYEILEKERKEAEQKKKDRHDEIVGVFISFFYCGINACDHVPGDSKMYNEGLKLWKNRKN